MDISRPLLLRAEQRAPQDGLVMVFSDPTAAFANIARGLRPSGWLVFVCWQGLVDNEWVTVPAGAAQHIPCRP